MPFRGPRLTISLLTGLVLVVLLGSGAAMAISHQRKAATPVASTGAARIGSSANAAPPDTASPPHARSAGPFPTAGAAPVGPSNNLTVQMSAAVQRSRRAVDVQQALQGYFDAINQHNYAAWTQSVTGEMANAQGSVQWLDAYATTIDSSIWMQSLSEHPLRVGVRFTSQQDSDLAPADLPVACIDWSVSYGLESRDGRLVVGSTLPGSVSMAKC